MYLFIIFLHMKLFLGFTVSPPAPTHQLPNSCLFLLQLRYEFRLLLGLDHFSGLKKSLSALVEAVESMMKKTEEVSIPYQF